MKEFFKYKDKLIQDVIDTKGLQDTEKYKKDFNVLIDKYIDTNTKVGETHYWKRLLNDLQQGKLNARIEEIQNTRFNEHILKGLDKIKKVVDANQFSNIEKKIAK